jgi:hypothetical protein
VCNGIGNRGQIVSSFHFGARGLLVVFHSQALLIDIHVMVFVPDSTPMFELPSSPFFSSHLPSLFRSHIPCCLLVLPPRNNPSIRPSRPVSFLVNRIFVSSPCRVFRFILSISDEYFHVASCGSMRGCYRHIESIPGPGIARLKLRRR